MNLRISHKTTLSVLLASCFLIGCQKETTGDGHHHGAHDDGHHAHKPLEVSDLDSSAPIPAVSATVTQDTMAGWNLHIQTENFVFTPEKVNLENIAGEGHAHLYINGHKLSRIYSEWYHLNNFRPGKYDLMVTLNANDHSPWAHQGKVISTTISIKQKIK